MKKMLRLFLMSVLCGILPVSLLLSGVSVSAYTGNSAQTITSGADIRVMSYNTLVDNDETLGGWSWGQPLGNRGDKAAAAINYYKPDVIGLQENNYKWHVALRANLPDYDYVNADVPEQQKLEARESLGKKDWMCTTMMYNTKTLKLIHNELIGYSVNYWGCIQRMRYISMAVFEVKATGERFVFTSTHLDAEKDRKGDTMRRTQSTELADRLNHYKDTYGYPIISTGDYNKGYNDEPLRIVREQAEMDSHPNNRGGIDYVLYSKGVTGKYFTVINDADLAGASDHQPIMADLALDNGFDFPTTKPIPTTTTTTTVKTTVTTTTRPAVTTEGSTRPTPLRPTGIGGTTTTVPVAEEPVDSTVSAADPTTTGIAVPIVPTGETPANPTDPVEDSPVGTAPSNDAPVADDEQPTVGEPADPVEKGNDTLIYVLVGSGAVVIAAGVVLFLLLKKK